MTTTEGKYSVETMVAAIEVGRGNVTRAAAALGCSARTVYNYAKKYPEVQEAIDGAREEITDLVEDAFIEKCLSGDTAALIFYMKTRGRTRGYTEKTEVQHSGVISIGLPPAMLTPPPEPEPEA